MIENIKIPEKLCGKYEKTFAFETIRNRLPVTITKSIDYICRFRNDLMKRYSNEASDDCKNAIERLSELRYELTTDKKLRKVIDEVDDYQIWNNAIEELENEVGEKNCTWFKSPWLFSECYMYRRMREAMLLCKTSMKEYDLFEQAKSDTYKSSHESTIDLIIGLCPLDFETEEKNNTNNVLYDRFRIAMEAVLWANKNDLSLSSGKDVSSKVKNLIDLLESLKRHILCDHTEQLWIFLNDLKLKNATAPVRIDIILDNCSIELASDLILSDFLLRNNFVSEIHLHAKSYPWFVSDVTHHDFENFFKLLQAENSIIINRFYARLKGYINNKSLVLNSKNQFWTLPYSFDQMERIEPSLYNDFKQNSSLIVFKGDLNYRKLIGDLNWCHDTPLSVAVRNFKPTSLCAVRTLKADLVANLDINENTNEAYKLARSETEGNKWMITGDYGVIQLLDLSN